jgi:hypothetical protein
MATAITKSKGKRATPTRVKFTWQNSGKCGNAKAAQNFRTEIEDAVIAAKGEIGIYEASRIHTAGLAFVQMRRISGLLAETDRPKKDKPESLHRPIGVTITKEKQLGDGTKVTEQIGLTIEQWLALHDKLLRSKELVDKCLLSLGLGAKEAASVWDEIYRRPPLEVTNGNDDEDETPDAGTEPVNGQAGDANGQSEETKAAEET